MVFRVQVQDPLKGSPRKLKALAFQKLETVREELLDLLKAHLFGDRRYGFINLRCQRVDLFDLFIGV